MPQNYYDDIAARFAIGPDDLLAFRERCLFYDEDEAGRQLQLYGTPFDNGVFFEIVQRIGGYAGYGAPDAPFRIAAQKRLGRARAMPRT